MTNNETKTEKTTIDYSAVSTLWGTKLGEVEAWQIARANFNNFLDDSEKEPFGKFFEKKSDKAGNSNDISTQALAWLLHTSAGNIEAKYKNAKTKELEKCASSGVTFDKQAFLEGFIVDMLAPNLAEERAKREAELAKTRAENIAFNKSVLDSVENAIPMADSFGVNLVGNAQAVKNACKKKLEAGDHASRVYCYTLVGRTLGDSDELHDVFTELGLTSDDALPELNELGDIVK
jgi:hypothetical protein